MIGLLLGNFLTTMPLSAKAAAAMRKARIWGSDKPVAPDPPTATPIPTTDKSAPSKPRERNDSKPCKAAKNDEAAEARIQWNLLNVYRMIGQNDLALRAGERSLDLAKKLGLKEQLAYTTNDLGYVYQAIGNIEIMNRVLEISTSLWRELQNLPMLTDSLTSYANNLFYIGQLDQALSTSAEAQSISKALNNPWSESFSLFTVCFVHWYHMETTQALEAMRRCIALAKEVGFIGGQVTMSNYQTQLLLPLGEIEQARKVMQGIRELAKHKIPLFFSGATAADAMIAIENGDIDLAAEILSPYSLDDPLFDLMNSFTLEYCICEYHRRQKAFGRIIQYATKIVAFLEKHRFVTFLPQFLYMQAVGFCGQGKADEARLRLQDALSLCNDLGTRWKKQEIKDLLTNISANSSQKIS